MTVEIDGIKIDKASYAEALAAQGFITQEELKLALKQLPSDELDLGGSLAKLHDNNQKTSFYKVILRELGLEKRE